MIRTVKPGTMPRTAMMTDTQYAARVDNTKPVAVWAAGALRCRSSDMSTPRYVAGQHKGVTAEGYWAGWTRPLDDGRIKPRRT